jgi:hypothetical protein
MSVVEVEIFLRASAWEVNVADHHSKKSDPLIQLPDIEKLEEEVKSQS